MTKEIIILAILLLLITTALLLYLKSVVKNFFVPVKDFDVYVNQITFDRHISYDGKTTLCSINLMGDIHIRDNFSNDVYICTACLSKLNPAVLTEYARLIDAEDRLHEFNTLVQ